MFNLKLRRRLKKDGSLIESSFLLFLNNESPMTFPTRSDVASYLSKYRKDNDIFNLQIFRIETYSL